MSLSHTPAAAGDAIESLPQVAQSPVWGGPQLREAMIDTLKAVCIVFV
jgi:hypothetical protein